MAGTTSDSGVGRPLEGALSGEALAEWRSSEEVENGIPSTSPPYWDTDDDEDCEPKPSDLYGKYTWKIDKFSQINKRELRSNAFEVGSYKWYILIYPQGCDVCNHLSLFLCVANHDKLLPGWSHFAQFTIAVVNKDPKKSKYSDTLHRFWKKEHDWGWKKFMELSKVADGFIDADTLIIKAQVQVIRDRVDRPFRCLDGQYRRELVRVYLTNVEQICRRFVEERRNKLGKLIEDKARWSSFCAFWLAIDQSARRHMSKEKTDAILRVVVKHFFIEKEVTSTLVMDSLYSGLRALEGQAKSKIDREKLQNAEESPVPIVHTEKDMFVLVDDVLLLLERATMEPLPPKDDKGPQSRMKDGCLEDFSKDSIERDERRLTELGRRTIEIFVLAQIFGKIEIAYQEAVALQRQEELIREEAVWLAEIERKAKRGVAEKGKKSKKKQGRQKRSNCKGKDKGRDKKPGVAVEDKVQQGNPSDDGKDLMADEAEPVFDKLETLEDVSDVSDSVYCLPEIPRPDTDEKDASPVCWETDASEVHPPTEASSSGVSGHSGVQSRTRERNSPSLVDDSSSTCSTDSVPSVVMNSLYRWNSLPKQKSRKSVNRVKSQRGSATSDGAGWFNAARNRQSEAICGASQLIGAPGIGKFELKSKAAALSMKGRKKEEQHVVKKEKVVSLQRESSIKDRAIVERPSKDKATRVRSYPGIPYKTTPSAVQIKPESKTAGATNPVLIRKPSSDFPQVGERATSLINTDDSTATSKSEAHKVATQIPANKPSVQQLPIVSRPLSAPIVPGPKPAAPVVSIVQASPVLSRSVSAAERLVPDPSPSYLPQSYRNAIMGISQSHSPSSALNSSQSLSRPSNLISTPMSLPLSSENAEPMYSKPSLTFRKANHDALKNEPHSKESHQRDDINNHGVYKTSQSGSQDHLSEDFQSSASGRQNQSGMGDEFPHLDIINNLLDDDQGFTLERFQSLSSEPPHLNHCCSFPVDIRKSNDLCPSTSSYRFEQSYYDDRSQLGYGSLAGRFDSLALGDVIPQVNPSVYVNEQIDRLIPNQWQMDDPDLSYHSMMNAENDGFPNPFFEYANLACSVMDYTVFEPSNAH